MAWITWAISHARGRGTTCVVTGCPAAVTSRQRQDLEQLLARNQPAEMRTAVALASRESSRRTDGKVGEECVVAHLLPDGPGEAQVFGNLQAEFMPALISNGVNVATVVQQSGLPGPAVLVGVTWTGNEQMNGMCMAYRELSKQTGTGWPEGTGK